MAAAIERAERGGASSGVCIVDQLSPAQRAAVERIEARLSSPPRTVIVRQINRCSSYGSYSLRIGFHRGGMSMPQSTSTLCCRRTSIMHISTLVLLSYLSESAP